MLRKGIYTGHLARLHGGIMPLVALGQTRQVSNLETLRERKWYSFDWTPRRPIVGKFRDVQAGGDQTNYPFLLRQSSDRFILLSSHQAAVQAFFRECRVAQLIEYPRLNIVSLVRHLSFPDAEDGAPYRLGTVFASAEGYGRRLNTLAFWGENIGEGAWFKKLISKKAHGQNTAVGSCESSEDSLGVYQSDKQQPPDITPTVLPFRATLRDRTTKQEIASIGSDGEVSMFLRGVGHLIEIDRLFRYLNDVHMIGWGVTHE